MSYSRFVNDIRSPRLVNNAEKTRMIIPVRCVTCGKVISDKWRYYQFRTGDRDDDAPGKKNKKGGGDTPLTRKQAMDDLGLVRYCCRRHFIGQVDLIEKI